MASEVKITRYSLQQGYVQKKRIKWNFNIVNTEIPKPFAPHASQGTENQTYIL